MPTSTRRPRKAELPRDYAARMAREKALAAADRAAHVLAGDTVVAVGRRILPKAEDEATARACLELMSGRRHRVLSAVALLAPDGTLRERLSETQVRFKPLSAEEIARLPRRRRMARQGRRLRHPGQRRGADRVDRAAAIRASSACRCSRPARCSRARGFPLAEWLVEEGIGEHRAIRLDGDRIVAARVEWPGELAAGLVEDAVLVSRAAGSRRGTARFASGEEALVDRLPPSASEGAPIRLEVTRPALGERGRRKLARAQADRRRAAPRPDARRTAARRRARGARRPRVSRPATAPSSPPKPSPAKSPSPAAALQFSPTPAMLLVDVDGTLDPRALALAAVAPLAEALRRFDVGGSIGIDFPTLADKADRRAVDEALAAALADWPHERTAMNGFGFVQLVARLERPSLLHRAAFQRAGMAARALLRRAELLRAPGAVLLSGHPALEAQLRPEWLAELARRTGREVRWEARPGPCHRGPAGPTRAAMSTRPCPICRKPRSRAIHAVLLEPLPRPRPRALVQRRLRGARPAGRSRGPRATRTEPPLPSARPFVIGARSNRRTAASRRASGCLPG